MENVPENTGEPASRLGVRRSHYIYVSIFATQYISVYIRRVDRSLAPHSLARTGGVRLAASTVARCLTESTTRAADAATTRRSAECHPKPPP